MEKHVIHHHTDEYKALMNEWVEKKLRNNSTDNFGLTKLSDYLAVTNCPNYEDALLNWIVQTYQPLNVADIEQESPSNITCLPCCKKKHQYFSFGSK